ncbi:hypothetical protein FNF27_03587 [Cafeteria roenbergensis]|uniref:Uncharacterized protein n=1 Tax=Cafeteria roenbergensis TaxID=33653 RepID=A0A5A8EBB6_CAFRO|nr:hypothetical protein FNF27_03587 [Cafeteria roenbergensis]
MILTGRGRPVPDMIERGTFAETTTHLLSRLWDKNCLVDGHDTLLGLAARHNELAIVAKLCSLDGISLEATDLEGNTPLAIAASRGHTEVVKYLIGQGANRRAVNDAGYQPIHLAARHHLETALAMIIDREDTTAVVAKPATLGVLWRQCAQQARPVSAFVPWLLAHCGLAGTNSLGHTQGQLPDMGPGREEADEAARTTAPSPTHLLGDAEGGEIKEEAPASDAEPAAAAAMELLDCDAAPLGGDSEAVAPAPDAEPAAAAAMELLDCDAAPLGGDSEAVAPAPDAEPAAAAAMELLDCDAAPLGGDSEAVAPAPDAEPAAAAAMELLDCDAAPLGGDSEAVAPAPDAEPAVTAAEEDCSKTELDEEARRLADFLRDLAE